MTTKFPSSSQNSAGGLNILSPEAKEFVPRQLSDPSPAFGGPAPFDPAVAAGDGLLGPGPLCSQSVDVIPRYMTTCYPFVATSDARLGSHPRLPGKFDNQVFMPQFHAAGVRQRFQQPGTNGFTLPPTWNQQPGGVCFGGLPRIPNGMPFDGGTFQNGIRPLGFPQMFHNQSLRPLNGVVDPSRVLLGVEHNEDVCMTEKADSDDTSRTVALQTDFPAEIADSSLDDMPNTLFQKNFSNIQNNIGQDTKTKFKNKPSVSKRSYSNADVPSSTQSLMTSSVQGDHVTKLHSGKSGTLPKEETRSGSDANFNGSLESTQYLSSGANVPYLNNNPTGISYASVAQGRPSQSNLSSKNVNFSHVSNNYIYRSSVSLATSDAKTCDTSSKDSLGLKSGNKARYGTINVLDIINDLEKADLKNEESKNEVKNKVMEKDKVPSDKLNITAQEFRPSAAYQINGEVASLSQSVNAVASPGSYGIPQLPPHFPMQGWPWTSKENMMQVNGLKFVPGVGEMSWQPMFPPPIPPVNSQGHIGLIGPISFSDAVRRPPSTQNLANPVCNATNVTSTNTNTGQGSTTEADGEQKKKKRRRRRRKKKNSESAGDGENVDCDDACSGANDDVILHFEDEAEFPDLACGTGRSVERPTASVVTSYGDVLKNTQVQSTLSSQDDSCAQLSNSESNPATKETRTSRKRRKRRESANKAADAEMAEINLEQHMLELKMKQKLPLSARKSASPVRNTASQGVWKLAPSSPVTSNPTTLSTGGKKVSLLLPGTVALEPTYQPNTSIKQPGILKTSSHVVTPPPPVSQGSAGGGKKSKMPIMCDLGALIDAFEVKKVQEQKKELKLLTPRKEEVKQLNPLDSNAPAVKRGKERETPKAKKPSPLKKVILKEREEKKRLRLLDEEEVNQSMHIASFPNSPISAPVGIGVVSGGESDLSQDTSSFHQTDIVGIGTPNSAELSPISQPSPSCMSSLSPGTSPLSSGLTSPMTSTLQQTVKLKIHSRRFREYCNQVLDKEIDTSVTALLQDLVRFQDKQYHKDPIKAKAKRRFVLGLREVTKHLRLKKIKCVIISPNLEKIQSKGGLDDALNNILELCNDQKVPFIFGLGRRALGRACAKLVPVSVVGVFNYEGSEENFRTLVSLTEKAREQYREMIHQIEKEIAEHPPRVSIPGVPHIFAHMGHSRTPSGCSVISFTSSILSEPISENYPHSEPETDDRGYEIEKDVEDVDELEGDLENVEDGVGDGEGDEGSESENDETGYEADSEVGFDKRKKRFGRRRAGGMGSGGVGVVDYTNLNGVRHDDIGTVNGGTMVNGVGAGAGSVTCRPGILKNSAERLRLMKAGNHGIDTGKEITNHVSGSGDAMVSNSDDKNDSSQHRESCDIQLSRNNDSAGHADNNHPTSNGTATQSPLLENGINNSFVTVTVKTPIVNGDLVDTDSSSTRELDFKTCDEDSDFERQVQSKENQDRLEDLPRFIDSVHTLDLESTLSQYSSKTAETGEIEVLSTHSSKTTHSSRTLGEGGNTEREKSLKTAVFDGRRGRGSSNPSPVNNGTIGGVGKSDRENRTLSWVQEAQSIHFGEQGPGAVGGQGEEGEGRGMECVDGGV
ncbi:uncharacterized protein LOC127869273 isoform X1 [Dreissena polymorpha]|uniref:uncharacterized protein LOC127869273 isoform X1 n=1 Tax=Dreissena polymorpha TaxID=45954 RepID=UPI002264D2E1|nr:uncharacterized protein LOC127869273 isoform X1 [Dreissena polymorpha]